MLDMAERLEGRLLQDGGIFVGVSGGDGKANSNVGHVGNVEEWKSRGSQKTDRDGNSRKREERTSRLGFVDGSIWVRLGPALPEAIAALLLDRVVNQNLVLAAATVVGLVTEGARGCPRAGGGRRLIHAEVGFRTFAAGS